VCRRRQVPAASTAARHLRPGIYMLQTIDRRPRQCGARTCSVGCPNEQGCAYSFSRHHIKLVLKLGRVTTCTWLLCLSSPFLRGDLDSNQTPTVVRAHATMPVMFAYQLQSVSSACAVAKSIFNTSNVLAEAQLAACGLCLLAFVWQSACSNMCSSSGRRPWLPLYDHAYDQRLHLAPRTRGPPHRSPQVPPGSRCPRRLMRRRSPSPSRCLQHLQIGAFMHEPTPRQSEEAQKWRKADRCK